jgi:long-chain acyl-CoA synthetase
VIVRAPDAEPTPEELMAFARDQLASYKLPRSAEFVSELPRTPAGKVLKRELRERYARPNAAALGSAREET